MRLSGYKSLRDSYSFSELGRNKGTKLVSEKEPVVSYDFEGDEIKVYENLRGNSWLKLWEPDYVIEVGVELAGEVREMYLGGTLQEWDDLDRSLMESTKDRTVIKNIMP